MVPQTAAWCHSTPRCSPANRVRSADRGSGFDQAGEAYLGALPKLGLRLVHSGDVGSIQRRGGDQSITVVCERHANQLLAAHFRPHSLQQVSEGREPLRKRHRRHTAPHVACTQCWPRTTLHLKFPVRQIFGWLVRAALAYRGGRSPSRSGLFVTTTTVSVYGTHM